MKGHGQAFVVWEKVSVIKTKNGKDKDKDGDKDKDNDNEKVNICHERAKTGDCGQLSQRNPAQTSNSQQGLDLGFWIWLLM